MFYYIDSDGELKSSEHLTSTLIHTLRAKRIYKGVFFKDKWERVVFKKKHMQFHPIAANHDISQEKILELLMG